MKSKDYDKEMAEIHDLLGQGYKLSEVAEITGVSRGTISCRLSREKARAKKEAVVGPKTPDAIVKEKTLDDFAPRDIFKHLHKLGYRLEGKVYMMTKQYVNIQSIINE